MSIVFLFDLDGTLCRSRKKVQKNIIETLSKANQSVEIGILTGSDLDFLKEQCEELFLSLPHKHKVYAMACNGTKSFVVEKSDNKIIYHLLKEESIKNHIGGSSFTELMRELVFMQAELITGDVIPLTGNFIASRGSTINWCPIGRGADDRDRAIFVEKDKNEGLRKKQLKKLQDFLEANSLDLVANIAGDTSFDIYPENWDKTYAMQFFKNYDVYFWGDRMFTNGNDYTMHLLLKENSFPIKDPDDTNNSVLSLMKLLDIS
jgi:phosphomannomutase